MKAPPAFPRLRRSQWRIERLPYPTSTPRPARPPAADCETGVVTRSELDPRVQAAIALVENAPIGRQLADYRERAGRCWRSSTRFLSALRESGADGELLVWTGQGWEHGAIQLKSSDIVVDWTASQFEADPNKAKAYDYPCIRTRAATDAACGESYVFRFEDPFFRGSNSLPEQVLPWDKARERVAGVDSQQALHAPRR